MNVEAFDTLAGLPIAHIPPSAMAPANVATARYADRGYLTRTTDTPANTLFEARLMGDIEIAQSVIDALAVGGLVSLTASELELWNGDDVFNALAAEGRLDGRPVRIKIVQASDRAASDWGSAFSAASTIWTGRANRLDAQGLRARIALSDVTDRFATPLQASLYTGAGGLNGPAELKGRPKPVSLGYRYNVTPVYLGLADLGFGSLPTYQTNWRAIAGHDTVRIRGVVQTLTGVTPAIGQWVDFPSLGCFQLGSSPDGTVTCDVRGDAPGGVYARSLPDIVRVLLQALGPGLADSDLDPWTWFQLQQQMQSEIGWGIGADVVTADAALAEVLASGSAWVSGSRAGQLRIARLGNPEVLPDFALTEADILACTPQPVPAQLQPAPQVVEIRAARNWTPLDDIAGSVVDPDRAALISEGAIERAVSSVIALRSTRARTLTVPGLYRYAADAQTRAGELQLWLERGLKVFTIETDRYLHQVELGMTGRATYPFYGLSAGWSGVVVGYREKIGARRLEVTMIG